MSGSAVSLQNERLKGQPAGRTIMVMMHGQSIEEMLLLVETSPGRLARINVSSTVQCVFSPRVPSSD